MINWYRSFRIRPIQGRYPLKLARPAETNDGGRATGDKSSPRATASDTVPESFAIALDRFLDGAAKLRDVREALAKSLYDSLEPAEALLAALEEAKQQRGLPPAAFSALAMDLRQITTEETPTDISPGAGRAPRKRQPVTERARPQAPQRTATFAEPAIRPGVLLRGRFQLEDRLPGGNMGEVYRAIDRVRLEAGEDDATVAVKILNPELSDSAESLERFRKEAFNAQRLAHPNIVRVFDLDQAEGRSFITMEWLRGESLAARLDDIGPRPMVWSQTKRILEGLGAALQYTHREGFVHGDIKPANVYLTADQGVKLLDFGLATSILARPEAVGSTKRPFAITHEYASREVLGGQRPTIQDDVFSLSCLAYRLLAGYRPFNDRSRETNKLSRPKSLSPRQWSILRRGLAEKRADRPQDVGELLDGLLAERHIKSALLNQRAAIVGLLTVVAIAALWLLWPQRSEPPASPQQSATPTSQDASDAMAPSPIFEEAPAATTETDEVAGKGETRPGDAISASDAATAQSDDSPQTEAGGAASSPGVVDPVADHGVGLESQAAELPGEAPLEAELADEPFAASEPLPELAPADELPAAEAEPEVPPAANPGFARTRYEIGESEMFVRLVVVAPRDRSGPVTWRIRTVDGVAISGKDYIGDLADSVTVEAGADRAEILIPIVSDAVPEFIEDFTVVLDGPGVSASPATSEAVVMIIDDDS